MVAQKIVKGPLLSTFSFQDTVVGHAYAITSRLAGQRQGARRRQRSVRWDRPQRDAEDDRIGKGHPAHARDAYTFAADVVNNLDGSGGLIKNHSDITNTTVTYAFASAMART